MEAEERPPKLRKIDHDVSSHEISSKVEPASAAMSADSPEIPEDILPNKIPGNILNQESNSSGSESENVSHDYRSENTNKQLSSQPPLSKNQLKKLRNKEKWEAGRGDRKLKRKQKILEKKARKRAAKAEAEEAARLRADRLDPDRPNRRTHTRLPISIIIDCGFDDLMTEKEMISLGSQLTRCYSDNFKAPFQAHILISSWKDRLKTRFDTVLSKQYEGWRGVTFVEQDFVEAAERSKQLMRGKRGGRMAGAFASNPEAAAADASVQDASASDKTGEVVYLTSDSPHTLDRLKPYSTYIVGGLVDKNRHKGICYKTATARNIATAKLPIGEFMEMQSRFVLATNHVVEIMVRWLEFGDWGQAFVHVMPKRKGGRLKAASDAVATEENAQIVGGEEKKEEEEEEEEEERDENEGNDKADNVSVGAMAAAGSGLPSVEDPIR